MIDENQQNPNTEPDQNPSDEGVSQTPSNPEMEAVQANQPSAVNEVSESVPPPAEKPVTPVEQVSSAKPEEKKPESDKGVKPEEKKPESEAHKAQSVAPKKIGVERKKPSKTKFLLGCSGGGLLLFVVFIVLMVLMMAKAGADNPVMRAFGLDPAGIKTFLLTVIGLAFGMLSLLFFVLTVIGVFRLLGAKKGDKEAKGKGIKMTLFSFIPFILILFIWFVLYSFIGSVPIAAEQVTAEIIIVEPADTEELQAPIEITLSALNVAKALQLGGIAIGSMDWDLEGDGEFETPVGTSPEVVHLYNRRGTFEVGLRVTVVDEETPRIYTKVLNIQEAVFGADPAMGYAPLDVQFDASGLIPKGFKVSSLDWDFDGDDKYDIEGPDNLRPRYTFEQIGVYNVHLRIVDQKNNVENYYRDIEITPSDTPLLSAVIDTTPGTTGPIPLQIRFDASESSSMKGRIISYEWDFGDGSDLQSGKSASHIFNEPGFYTVELIVEEDSGKIASASIEIEAQSISSIPEAIISTDPAYDTETDTLTGTLPFKVDFDASDSLDLDNDIIDYQWDFDGDDVTDQEGKKSTNTFEESGTYEVALTITDTEDQSSTAVITVVVEEPGVKAVITADPEEGTAPLVVNFDGSSSSTFDGSIVSYRWDFGDGSPETITGATVSHKYNEVGNYTVGLIVTTNKNETGETSQIIYVREIPLRACFTPSRYNGEAPLAVTFDPKCSTGAVSTFSWDFGDDESSDSRKPTHTFEYPGNYTVILEVSDDKSNVSSYSEVIVAEGEVTP